MTRKRKRLVLGTTATALLIAVAAFVAWRHFALARSLSRGEPYLVIGKISAAEELYRVDHLVYASTTDSFPRYFPKSPTDAAGFWENTGHPDYLKWQALGVDLHGSSRFGYSVIAGNAAQDLPQLPMFRSPPDWQAPSGRPWWILVAEGPAEKGGCVSRIAAASFSDEMYVEYEPPQCQ
jgi:hypothetical protein